MVSEMFLGIELSYLIIYWATKDKFFKILFDVLKFFLKTLQASDISYHFLL